MMNQTTGRPARINVKVLVILISITGLLGVAALVGHRVRNKYIASDALAKGKAALVEKNWSAAANHLRDYLLRFPEDAEMLRAYARARLAIRPFHVNNASAAVDTYRRLLRLKPDDVEAAHALAKLYFQMRDFTESAYICRQRLKIEANDGVAMMWLGRSLGAQRKLMEAAETLERLVELEPDSVRAFALLSAIALNRSGRVGTDEALAWLDRAVKANPQSAEAWARRARFRRDKMEDKDAEDAASDLEIAAGLTTTDPQVMLLIADEWMSLGKFDRARKGIEAVDAFDEETLYDLDLDVQGFALAKLTSAGKLALFQRRKEEGVLIADRALDELSKSHRVLYLPIAVDLYIAGGMVEKARASLTEYSESIRKQNDTRETIEEELALADAVVARAEDRPYAVIGVLADLVIISPNQSKAWRLLWKAYEKTGQQRRALYALEAYVGLRPDDANAMLILAETYRNRDWTKVAHFAGRVLQTLPDNAEAKMLSIEARLHNARGTLTKKRLADLRKQLSDLAKDAPQNVNVRLIGAFAAFMEGDPEGASRELERAIRESDDPLTAAMQLAEFHAQRGELDEAIEVCRAAKQAHPDVAMPWLGLAELQIAAENVDEAKAMLGEAVERLSGNERVRAVYALVRHLITHGDRPAAIEMLAQLATERPGDIRPRVALLATNEVVAGAAESARLIAEIKAIEGENGAYWRIEQSRLLLRGDSWKEKEQEIDQMLIYCSRVDPGWASPILLRGHMQERLGRNIQAEQIYRNALRLFPDEVEVVSRLLSLLERSGRFAEAQFILDRLPKKLTALSAHRVQVALGQGKFESAIEELDRRVTSDPYDVPSRVILARLLYKRDGQLDRSLALLDEAALIAPKELSVVSSRAAMLQFAGREAEAIALLDREVERRDDFQVYRLRAGFYETNGKLDLAERDYRHLLTFGAETSAQSYVALGTFFERQGRRQDAVGAWESGLEADENNTQLQRLMISVLMIATNADDQARGRRMLEKLVMQDPDDLGTLLLQSGMFLRDGSPAALKQAEVVLERIIQVNPRHVQAHLRLILIAREIGDVDQVDQRLTNALGLNPNNEELTMAQAGFEADRNNLHIARDLAGSVLRANPKNVRARNLLSRLAIELGNPQTAQALNAEALELDPSDVTAQLVRARLLQLEKKHTEAIAHLEAYCATEPGSQSTKSVLALIQLHRETGDFASAQRRLKDADQLAPSDPLVHLEHLRLLAAQKRYAEVLTYLANHTADVSVVITGAWILAASTEDHYRDQAKTLFERAIAASPDLLSGHLGLAQLHYRTGDIESAVRAYRRLLEIDPFHSNALNDLAWILSTELGQHDEAVLLADRGATRYPNDPHVLDTRGVILTKIGRLDDARADLEQCIRLSTKLLATKAQGLRHLAEVLARQGDPTAATARLDEALAIHRTASVFSTAEIAGTRELISKQP